MTAKTLDSVEFMDIVNDAGLHREQVEQMNCWLERGDGVAVYRNVDLGHPEVGHVRFLSYGSSEAQLEVEEPPMRMPDIGAACWRYYLKGTYRGEAL